MEEVGIDCHVGPIIHTAETIFPDALAKGDRPIGTVITHNNKVISVNSVISNSYHNHLQHSIIQVLISSSDFFL